MTANKEIIRRLVDGVWGDRNLGLIDELIAQDYVGHDPTQPAPIQGRDGFKTNSSTCTNPRSTTRRSRSTTRSPRVTRSSPGGRAVALTPAS